MRRVGQSRRQSACIQVVSDENSVLVRAPGSLVRGEPISIIPVGAELVEVGCGTRVELAIEKDSQRCASCVPFAFQVEDVSGRCVSCSVCKVPPVSSKN